MLEFIIIFISILAFIPLFYWVNSWRKEQILKEMDYMKIIKHFCKITKTQIDHDYLRFRSKINEVHFINFYKQHNHFQALELFPDETDHILFRSILEKLLKSKKYLRFAAKGTDYDSEMQIINSLLNNCENKMKFGFLDRYFKENMGEPEDLGNNIYILLQKNQIGSFCGKCDPCSCKKKIY